MQKLLVVFFSLKNLIFAMIFTSALWPDEVWGLDKSIYFGKWQSRGGDVQIDLVITNEKNITLMINGKEVVDFRFNFNYCKEYTVYPFLCIWTSYEGGKKFTHHIYVTIGAQGKATELNLLRGFYVTSVLIDEQREIEETIYYPIELIKINPSGLSPKVFTPSVQMEKIPD